MASIDLVIGGAYVAPDSDSISFVIGPEFTGTIYREDVFDTVGFNDSVFSNVDYYSTVLTDIMGFNDTISSIVDYLVTVTDSIGFNDNDSTTLTISTFATDSIGFSDLIFTGDLVVSWRGRTKIPRFGYGGFGFGELFGYGEGNIADLAQYLLVIRRRVDDVVLDEVEITIDDTINPDKLYFYPADVNITDNTNYTQDINFEVQQETTLGIRGKIETINYFYDNICHGFIPTEIDDCVFWVDACQEEDKYDREVITDWNELTGLTPNLTKFGTATADFQLYKNRINGLPSIAGVPGAALSSITALHATDTESTVFYISRMIGPSYGNILTGASDGPHRYGDKTLGYWNGTYDDCRHDDRVAYTVNVGTLPCDDKWRLHALRVYPVAGVGIIWYFYINGVFIAQKTMSNAVGFYRINVGGCTDSRTYSDFEISEIVAYNRLLDLDEMRDLNLYFRNKYNLEEISEEIPSA